MELLRDQIAKIEDRLVNVRGEEQSLLSRKRQCELDILTLLWDDTNGTDGLKKILSPLKRWNGTYREPVTNISWRSTFKKEDIPSATRQK
jgi:hypothetical protein